MEKDIERRQYASQQCLSLHLDYEIIKAVDGRLLSKEELLKSTRSDIAFPLTAAEVGCALSHHKIYRKMVDENIQMALVLEDDARLDPAVTEVLDYFDKHPFYQPCVVLLSKVDKYISLGAKSIVNTRKLVSVSQCSGAYAYIINLAGARKLNAFLFPVWIESDRWPFLRESAVLKIKAVFPPVGLLSSLNNSSSIWLTSDDIAIRDKVKKDRKKIYHALRQKRSLIAKIRNMFWRIFIRKFFEKNSQQ